MYRSILVPLDGSSFGEQALPASLSIARRARAAVRVVHAHVPVFANGLMSTYTLDTQERDHARSYLGEVVVRLQKATKVPVSSALLEGYVADALADHVKAAGADLVVMTTHGRGPLSRFWLGSVADELLRRLTVPVLLLRPSDGAAELAGDVRFRHMLVALDGTEFAEGVLAPAAELAALTEAELTLLRVVPPVPGPGLGYMGLPTAATDTA